MNKADSLRVAGSRPLERARGFEAFCAEATGSGCVSAADATGRSEGTAVSFIPRWAATF